MIIIIAAVIVLFFVLRLKNNLLNKHRKCIVISTIKSNSFY